MINYFFIYDSCVFYEIVLLSYFIKSLGHQVAFCSLGNADIVCWEGFTVKPNLQLKDIDFSTINSFTIPGGMIGNIVEDDKLVILLQKLLSSDKKLFAICSGVEYLNKYKLLKNRKSILNTTGNVIIDRNLLTATPNSYVDFALEAAKSLNLFIDEEDFMETVNFFKLFTKTLSENK